MKPWAFSGSLQVSYVCVFSVRLAATGAVHNSCENFAEAQKVLEEAQSFNPPRLEIVKGDKLKGKSLFAGFAVI